MPKPLKPDVALSGHFIDKIFGANAIICGQIFPEAAEAHGFPEWRYGTFRDLSPWLQEANLTGCGIFVMVNTGDGQGRNAKNIKAVTHVFVDLDGAPLAPVKNSGAPPHVLTQSSPGRYQAFWKVTGCALDDFPRYQRALAKRFNADPSISDLSRVMRLPGFYHLKGKPFLTTIESTTDLKPWSPDLLTTLLNLHLNGGNGNTTLPAQTNESKFAKGTRHQCLLTVIARLRNAGLSGDALFRAAQDANLIKCDPPLPETEISKLANYFTRKNVLEIRPTIIPQETEQPPHPAMAEDRQPGFALPTEAMISFEELYSEDFDPVRWIVHDFLPAGLTILAADPKSGKSWLAQHLAISVASGTKALDHFETTKSCVLSLSLEDSKNRFKYRLHKLLDGAPPPRGAYFCRKWPGLPEGARLINQWITETPNAGLIIVDTFAKIRGTLKRFSTDGIYERDYRDVSILQEIAQDHQVAIVLVHHLNKGDASDSYRRISGSQGLTGASDANYVMVTDRDKRECLLSQTGREMEDTKIWLKQCRETGVWFFMGTAADQASVETNDDIMSAFHDLARPAGPSELADYTGRSRKTIHKHLRKLLGEGLIEKSVSQGKYTVTPHCNPPREL